MDRVIELSGRETRVGREDTILLQMSMPLHIHTTLTTSRTHKAADPFWGCARFLPSLPPQLITNLNQGLPSFPAHFLVLLSPCSVVGFVFVLGGFPSYGPGKAGYWLLLLHRQLREMNLKPDLVPAVNHAWTLLSQDSRSP